jgi:hypothetical protein
MESVETRSKEGDGITPAIGIRQCKYPPKKEEEQRPQDYEQGKGGNVEPDGNAASRPVSHGEEGSEDRPVRLIGRQGAEGGCVGKKFRDVPEAPDIEVLLYNVAVVEVETISEVVGVGDGDAGRQDRRQEPKETFLSHRALSRRYNEALRLQSRFSHEEFEAVVVYQKSSLADK